MLMSAVAKGYGWRRQLPDHRDRPYTRPGDPTLAQSADLRPKMPPVYDQGQLGSCTANAIAGGLEYEDMRQGAKATVPSRLFIYYNERAMEGTVGTDSGAAIRDGIKSVNRQGVCPETDWPYDISMFTVKPPQGCYVAAEKDRLIQYGYVSTLGDLKHALTMGFSIAFGFTVYQSFESPQVARTGVMPLPQRNEQVLGGHAVLSCGYGVKGYEDFIVVRNSWGITWGAKGYFYMPYEALTGPGNVSDDAPINGAYLTADCWVIERVS